MSGHAFCDLPGLALSWSLSVPAQRPQPLPHLLTSEQPLGCGQKGSYCSWSLLSELLVSRFSTQTLPFRVCNFPCMHHPAIHHHPFHS